MISPYEHFAFLEFTIFSIFLTFYICSFYRQDDYSALYKVIFELYIQSILPESHWQSKSISSVIMFISILIFSTTCYMLLLFLIKMADFFIDLSHKAHIIKFTSKFNTFTPFYCLLLSLFAILKKRRFLL